MCAIRNPLFTLLLLFALDLLELVLQKIINVLAIIAPPNQIAQPCVARLSKKCNSCLLQATSPWTLAHSQKWEAQTSLSSSNRRRSCTFTSKCNLRNTIQTPSQLSTKPISHPTSSISLPSSKIFHPSFIHSPRLNLAPKSNNFYAIIGSSQGFVGSYANSRHAAPDQIGSFVISRIESARLTEIEYKTSMINQHSQFDVVVN